MILSPRRVATLASALAVSTLALVGPADAAGPPTCTVTTSGSFVVGQTVTATLTPAPPSGVNGDWIRVRDGEGDGLVLPGSGSADTFTPLVEAPSYTITKDDYGFDLEYAVSGTSYHCTSKLVLVKHPATPVAAAPTVSGKASVGKRLTAAVDSVLPGTTVSYRWVRTAKAKKGHGTVTTPIAGATGPSYKVKGKDRGSKVAAQVTYVQPAHEPTVLTTTSKKVK